MRIKSIHRLVTSGSHSCRLTNSSPIASGVVLCWRAIWNQATSSGANASSMKNGRYGSTASSSTSACVGGSRSCNGSGSVEIDAHAAAQRRRDVDKRVERKARDPAAEQIVDPWLRHAATASRFGLCPVVFLQACCDLLHQLGPRSQVRSLLGGVRDRIPNTSVALGFAHLLPPNNCLNRPFAISRSFLGVACVFLWKACRT